MKIFSSNAGGNSNGFDFSPASIDSAVHSSNINIKLSAPLGMCQRQILISYEFIGAFIIALLFCCSPSAIIWRVIAVVVDSVNRVFRRWSSAHIFIKCKEVVNPFIVHYYAVAAIPAVTLNVFVIASSFYSCPYFKFRGIAHAVSCASFYKRVYYAASAGFSVTASNTERKGNGTFPAPTLTQPFYFIATSFYRKQAYKAAEYLTGKVERSTVCYNSLIHKLTPIKFVLGVRALSRPVSPIITLGACHA